MPNHGGRKSGSASYAFLLTGQLKSLNTGKLQALQDICKRLGRNSPKKAGVTARTRAGQARLPDPELIRVELVIFAGQGFNLKGNRESHGVSASGRRAWPLLLCEAEPTLSDHHRVRMREGPVKLRRYPALQSFAEGAKRARLPKVRSAVRIAGSLLSEIRNRGGVHRFIMAIDRITVRGARQHNLKNINVEIPRDKFTVITGLSGSGKSSLAFDTIYAEGQRRYVESLSAYARQFLDQLEKPDVDSVDGLSPAISIEQKTVSRSPRSTVGTVTEVYDYMRLLFSSIGQPHCHKCGAAITRQSVEQIVQNVLGLTEGERVMILAPIVRGRKGEFKKELEKLAKDGFLRARVDGELLSLDEEIRLDKRRNHTIEAVVDRLLIKPGIKERLTESVRTALKLTGGAVLVSVVDGDEKLYSERMACVICGINVPPLEPRSFSFNSAYGACKRCHGLGTVLEIDPSKLIPEANCTADKLTFMGLADKQGAAYLKSALAAIAKHFGADIKSAFSELPKEVCDGFFHGVTGQLTFRQGLYSYQSPWKGALRWLRERLNEAPSEKIRVTLEELVSPSNCPDCKGRRLRSDSLAVRLGGRGIAEYTSLPIADSVAAFEEIKLNAREEQIAGQILREIKSRLRFLERVGLGYITLDRPSATLSGGEGQRIRLATQIGSQLRGVLYVLDEPSIGLHPRDNQKLLDTLSALRDLGNTVLVVEHDEETIRRADYVVDLGPGAGAHGGELVAFGTAEDVAHNPRSITGLYISGQKRLKCRRNAEPQTENI